MWGVWILAFFRLKHIVVVTRVCFLYALIPNPLVCNIKSLNIENSDMFAHARIDPSLTFLLYSALPNAALMDPDVAVPNFMNCSAANHTRKDLNSYAATMER